MENSFRYQSFLLRFWQAQTPGLPGRAAGWRSEIEHIQSGRCWKFDSLDETLDFLQRQAAGPDVLDRPTDSEKYITKECVE